MVDPESEARGLEEHKGFYNYQVLFIVEAAITAVIALTAFVWLSKGPGSAWWLKKGAEREWAEKRILLDRYEAGATDAGGGERRARRGSRDDEEEGEELLRGDEIEGGGEEAVLNGKIVGGEPGLTRRDVIEAFSDWKVWWLLPMNICSSVPGTGFAVFLPLVVKVCTLGFSGFLWPLVHKAGLMS